MTGAGGEAGGGVGEASGAAAGPVVSAQARAAQQAAAEALRLQDSVRLVVSALSAIGDSALQQSRFSARARVLELEVLPAAPHLGACVDRFCHELGTSMRPRPWTAQMAGRAEDIRALLEQMMEITTTVDIPGELGLPLELVSTVQAGVLDGLARLDRLREILELVDLGHGHVELPAAAAEAAPTAAAQWLVHAASRLLPPGSQGRYGEEFAAELCALADAHASPRAQLGHAVRQVAAVWALRRALSPTTPRHADPDRARETVGVGHDPAPGPDPVVRTWRRHRLRLRGPFDWWFARRQARIILREQVRAQYEEFLVDHRGRPFPGGRSRHRRRKGRG